MREELTKNSAKKKKGKRKMNKVERLIFCNLNKAVIGQLCMKNVVCLPGFLSHCPLAYPQNEVPRYGGFGTNS